MEKTERGREFPLTVSVSGVDDTGRNLHMELLPDDVSILKTRHLHEYEHRLNSLVADGQMQSWWKSRENSDEFVCAIYGALSRRHETTTATTTDCIVFNQGTAMIEAMVVAAVTFKANSSDLSAARKIVPALLQHRGIAIPKERYEILLQKNKILPNPLIQESHGKLEDVPILRNDDTADESHPVYQYFLQTAIQYQIDHGMFDHVVQLSAEDSVKSVQDKIRKSIGSIFPSPVLQPFPNSATILIGFSGAGELLQETLSSNICTRYSGIQSAVITSQYLDRIGSKEGSLKFSQLEIHQQALRLYHGIERYVNNHSAVSMVCVPGLASANVANQLKQWVGFNLLNVFVKDAGSPSTVDKKNHERQQPTRIAVCPQPSQQQGSGLRKVPNTQMAPTTQHSPSQTDQDDATERSSLRITKTCQPYQGDKDQPPIKTGIAHTVARPPSTTLTEDMSWTDVVLYKDDDVQESFTALTQAIDATGILHTSL